MTDDEKRVKLDTVLSRAFSAGGYCNAYETEDYETGLAKRTAELRPGLRKELQEAWRVAFTLGFFSTYELHEMGEHEETYREAYCSDAGRRCVVLGYVDARELDLTEEELAEVHDRMNAEEEASDG